MSPPIDAKAIVNPTLLVEVTSRSTEDYDRGDKLSHYKQIESCPTAPDASPLWNAGTPREHRVGSSATREGVSRSLWPSPTPPSPSTPCTTGSNSTPSERGESAPSSPG
ncbi:MAG: Uma2 family endonuclease [Polyangiaceae bacterium]|nr:Uma2 family endonuclease [Polyangiaceae bacterium]